MEVTPEALTLLALGWLPRKLRELEARDADPADWVFVVCDATEPVGRQLAIDLRVKGGASVAEATDAIKTQAAERAAAGQLTPVASTMRPGELVDLLNKKAASPGDRDALVALTEMLTRPAPSAHLRLVIVAGIRAGVCWVNVETWKPVPIERTLN